MNDIAIKIKNLSKRYRIGLKEEMPDTFGGVIAGWLKSPLTNFRQLRQLSHFSDNSHDPDDVIWAVKDVSFEVKQGEVVGIIGRNGAGKSTLLKIISRITEPTAGRVILNGRVSSLLEVGTGFHQELTGRENVYLNGTILGMSKQEVDRKFDEIVDFSGVEKFIDTPVKRYSSGMKVRLAFAVAAHLEPEILLVDEVLAVGDAEFQKKCLGKIKNVAGEGRTVLFVSHNMVALQSLCQRAIWLEEGQIKKEGESSQVVSDYLHSNASSLTEQVWDDIGAAPGNDIVRLHRVCVHPEDNSSSDPITMRTPFELEFEFWNLVPDTYLNLNFHLVTEQGIVAFANTPVDEPVWSGHPLPVGLFRSTCYIPGDLLNAGLHHIHLRVVKKSRVIYFHDNALSFEVQDSPERRGTWYGKTTGVVRPLLKWTTELLKNGSEIVVQPSENTGKN